MIATVLIGAAVGLLLLATRHIHLRQGYAHGPAMLLGALLVFALTAVGSRS
jgi:prepilin signal peptidase PulO-like enzyme (type II secretory pathway)